MNFDPNSPFNYDDISKKIFSYLKPQDTKQTLLVSQRFKNITQQTEVHQHTQNIKNIFQWIKNSQDPKKIEIKNLLKIFIKQINDSQTEDFESILLYQKVYLLFASVIILQKNADEALYESVPLLNRLYQLNPKLVEELFAKLDQKQADQLNLNLIIDNSELNKKYFDFIKLKEYLTFEKFIKKFENLEKKYFEIEDRANQLAAQPAAPPPQAQPVEQEESHSEIEEESHSVSNEESHSERNLNPIDEETFQALNINYLILKENLCDFLFEGYEAVGNSQHFLGNFLDSPNLDSLLTNLLELKYAFFGMMVFLNHHLDDDDEEIDNFFRELKKEGIMPHGFASWSNMKKELDEGNLNQLLSHPHPKILIYASIYSNLDVIPVQKCYKSIAKSLKSLNTSEENIYLLLATLTDLEIKNGLTTTYCPYFIFLCKDIIDIALQQNKVQAIQLFSRFFQPSPEHAIELDFQKALQSMDSLPELEAALNHFESLRTHLEGFLEQDGVPEKAISFTEFLNQCDDLHPAYLLYAYYQWMAKGIATFKTIEDFVTFIRDNELDLDDYLIALDFKPYPTALNNAQAIFHHLTAPQKKEFVSIFAELILKQHLWSFLDVDLEEFAQLMALDSEMLEVLSREIEAYLEEKFDNFTSQSSYDEVIEQIRLQDLAETKVLENEFYIIQGIIQLPDLNNLDEYVELLTNARNKVLSLKNRVLREFLAKNLKLRIHQLKLNLKKEDDDPYYLALIQQCQVLINSLEPENSKKRKADQVSLDESNRPPKKGKS